MASKGFLDLAEVLEEAATAISHSDIGQRLSRHLQDKHSGTGDYAYLVDTFGDDKSGHVVYSKNGRMKRATYKMGSAEGKPSVSIDCASAEDVTPRTTYEAAKIGGSETGKETRNQEHTAADLDLTGDIVPLREGAVGQDGTAYLKLIAPGRGSSGWYPPEVLERDGPKVFPKGTKSFWNHQTDAEEASRPEGDLRDLASVLTEDAHYLKNGPAGEGLYAKAKVFEQFRQPVDDLAKHIGMSIRAQGKAKEGKAPDGKTGPIIEQLTRGISVDYVTTPGAGGKILQLFEAARTVKSTSKRDADKPNDSKDTKEAATDMDAAEAKTLQEALATQAVELRRLRERQALTDAAGEAKKYFAGVRVSEAIQERVISRVLSGTVPLTEAGDLDAAKLKTLVEAETKSEVAYINQLSGGRIVTGMGSGAEAPTLTEADKAEAKERRLEEQNEFAGLFGFDDPKSMGAKIMREGRRAFRVNYNATGKRFSEGTEAA